MATDIRVKEHSGQSGGINTDSSKHALKYEAWDRNREATVLDLRAAVLSAIPPTYDGLGLSDLSWTEEDGTNRFWFTASYESRAAESLLRISWDSTGGNVRLTASRGTTRYPATGRIAPDFKSAIGVKDGAPEGIDAVIPALKLTFSYKWPKGVIDLAYVKSMAGLVGNTNSGTWYTFAAGELLFLGTTGEIDPTTPTDIQYHFAASKNVTGLSIGDIASIAKQGHQYLWVAFEDFADTSAKKLVQRPLAAYVEHIYGSDDFSTFGIGS
jgi:hypothetical protein